MSRPSSGAIKNAKSVKLQYFNGRGRAEKTRLAFAASGLPYEEETITDWPGFSSKTPYGKLPVLVVDGKQVGQSTAIFRFVAVEGGLTGTDSVDDAILDGVVDYTAEVETSVINVLFAGDEAKREEAKQKMLDQVSPGYLTNIENLLKNSSSGFFSNKGLTWADIAVFCTLDNVKDVSDFSPDEKTYPLVAKLLKNVAESKGIKEYLAKQPADGFNKK